MTTKDPATRGALSRDASMLAPRRPKITGAPKEAQPARSTQSASATLPGLLSLVLAHLLLQLLQPFPSCSQSTTAHFEFTCEFEMSKPEMR